MTFRRVVPYLVMIGALVAIVVALGGVKGLQFAAMGEAYASMPEHREYVGAHKAVEDEWEQTLTAIGSVVAVQGVMVSTDMPGVVEEILFEPGTRVQAGDVLLRLDTAVEEAELASALASQELAQLNVQRTRDLKERRAVSQADLDTAEADLKQAQARVAAIEATIGRKHVRAPFGGFLGIRLVNLGEYLSAGAPIVSLQALEALYVNFTLPQQRLSLVEPGMVVRVTSDTWPGQAFEGRLTAINPAIQQTTRSLDLQATFENKDLLLRPGMFVQVHLVLPDREPVIAIPVTAVLKAPYGDSVFLVETREDGALIARQRFVRTGRAMGDFVAVLEGIEPGETVVSSGAFKLRNDVRLEINNEQAPEPQLNPRPAEG